MKHLNMFKRGAERWRFSRKPIIYLPPKTVGELGMGTKELEVRLERLPAIKAVYVCSLEAAAPEEDAMKKIMNLAQAGNVFSQEGARLFGRNTYPAEKPGTHGYELYMCADNLGGKMAGAEEVEIPEGLYAVLRFKNLENIGFAWEKLWNWIENSGYEHVGWQKGKHGWVGGFEEQVNWRDQKPPAEWIFDLWVQLKE